MFIPDPETSGEETKVRLRWPWCQQARHSSEEAEKVVYEQLRTSLCTAGSDADKHNFAISPRILRQSLAHALLDLFTPQTSVYDSPNSNPNSTPPSHLETYLFVACALRQGRLSKRRTNCTQLFFSPFLIRATTIIARHEHTTSYLRTDTTR